MFQVFLDSLGPDEPNPIPAWMREDVFPFGQTEDTESIRVQEVNLPARPEPELSVIRSFLFGLDREAVGEAERGGQETGLSAADDDAPATEDGGSESAAAPVRLV